MINHEGCEFAKLCVEVFSKNSEYTACPKIDRVMECNWEAMKRGLGTSAGDMEGVTNVLMSALKAAFTIGLLASTCKVMVRLRDSMIGENLLEHKNNVEKCLDFSEN